jgi:hypothetical protein
MWNLFMMGRIRQGQIQNALQLEEVNMLREHQGLPPLELQPLVPSSWLRLLVWGTVLAFLGFVVLFVIALILG